MVVPLKIVTRHDVHPDLSKRAHKEVMRGAMLDVGIKWAFDLLPEHFQKGPQKQFGYAARTEKWKRTKRRLFGVGRAVEPDTDLVLTGRLRDQLTFSARRLIRAFPSRVRIGMYGPAYFTKRARSKHTLRILNEVLAMSTRHKQAATDAADSGFNARLRALRAGRRLRKTTSTN
jgi:hypothetical protein